MLTGEFTYKQIIEFAANVELRGANLYSTAASRLDYEPARNILLHLSEQEKQHEEYFLSLLKDVENNDKRIDQLDKEAMGYLSALAESDIFPSDDNEFIEQLRTLKDVIRISKQAEKNSILFYIELAKYSWDDSSAKVLKKIAQEEKRHLVQLQELDKLIEERDIYY